MEAVLNGSFIAVSVSAISAGVVNDGESFTPVMLTAKVAVAESAPSDTLTVKFSVVLALRALMAVALGVKL